MGNDWLGMFILQNGTTEIENQQLETKNRLFGMKNLKLDVENWKQTIK